jgi:CHASE1-domain containing sensor protein
VLFDSATAGAQALASTHLLHLADHHYQLDIRPSVVSCRQPPRAVLVVGLLGGLLSLLLAPCSTACSASASAP